MPETAAVTQTEACAAEDAAWARVQSLACDLAVELSLPGVTVRNLMDLQTGAVIDSRWEASTDVPIRVNGVLIAWGEFEVVSGRLAVRVTDLAEGEGE